MNMFSYWLVLQVGFLAYRLLPDNGSVSANKASVVYAVTSGLTLIGWRWLEYINKPKIIQRQCGFVEKYRNL